MRKITKILVVLCALSVVFAGQVFAQEEPAPPTMVDVGTVMPDDVTVTDLDGKKIVLNKDVNNYMIGSNRQL